MAAFKMSFWVVLFALAISAGARIMQKRECSRDVDCVFIIKCSGLKLCQDNGKCICVGGAEQQQQHEDQFNNANDPSELVKRPTCHINGDCDGKIVCPVGIPYCVDGKCVCFGNRA